MQRQCRSLGTSLALIAGLLVIAQPAAAQTPDPHGIYENKCAGCHTAHAGDFVHEKLVRADGRLTIKGTSKDLQAFLEAGHGKLTPEETTLLVSHFTQILISGRLFQEKCRVCHDRAVEFARLNLIETDGILTGRYSHRDIAEFLRHHGRLEPDEVETMIAVLRRQLR